MKELLADAATDLASRSHYVELPDGIRLHAREHGRKERTCVLIHGSGEGGYVWDGVAERFAATHRLLAVDLRGHGDSQWDDADKYSAAQLIADVTYMLESLGTGPRVLIGHSLGGLIALNIAAAAPSLTTGLILVDFGLGMSQSAREHARTSFLQQFREYESVAAYASFLQSIRPMVSCAALRYLAGRALQRGANGRFRLKSDPAIACGKVEPFKDEEVMSQLQRVACPTLVLRGRASAMFPPAHAERMVGYLSNGRLYTVEKAGHAVMSDNPTGFAEVTSAFLRSLP